jgi:pimeloyl-ACP methyl ester carboxylesterase
MNPAPKNYYWRALGVMLMVLVVIGSASAQQTPSTREFFYVGGKYVGPAGSQLMAGQMYVEVLRPQRVSQKYPLVFFHGAGQTATNWMGTPDGRTGWADYFLKQGYIVYLVDQPARGRSAWHGSANSALAGVPAPTVEERFTAPEVKAIWAQAKKHTQWPGDGPKKGRMGDPIFDAFYATQVESITSAPETDTLVQAAGAALLDKIGNAILVTHSQAGTFGWLIADARPKLVKGILALEPSGPPFEAVIIGKGEARSWGLTEAPLTYDPPVKAPSELKKIHEEMADGPDLVPCWRQVDPPRKLPNLMGIPILILTAEASYHAVYDHCTSKYLMQAGVRNTLVRLETVGIHGNGHMLMLEKNNLEIAAFLHKWITQHVQ